MAKNKIEVNVTVDDKGSLKQVDKKAKNAAKSMGELDRNIKGTGQQSANATKNFSKMSQGMGGLVAVYAKIAAATFALSAAFQFLKGASEVTNLIKGQEALGAVTGVAYQSITKSLKDATDGQLHYAEAARAAAIGTAAGLSPAQLERMATAAKNVSFALGRDLTDSFNRLIRGVTKAEPELLDELGIILRLETATKEYADAIGKPVEQLTAFERSQAVANNVLDQAEKKYAAIQKIMDPSAAALNRFLASFDDLFNTVKTGLIDTLAPAFEFLANNTMSLVGALGLIAAPIIKGILPNMDEWVNNATHGIALQENKLFDLQKEYEATADSIKNLGRTKEQMLEKESRGAGATLGALGLDTSDASAGGARGVDFLTGGAVSPKAQANADKILKNAEKQIQKHGAVITGYLKGANAQQVADLRNSYNQRAAILATGERVQLSAWQRMQVRWKLAITKMEITWAGFQRLVIGGSKLMGKALNGITKLAGWIGLLALVVDLGVALYDWLFPLSEAEKAANALTEDFTSGLDTLNKELNRTGDSLAEIGLLGLEEQVVAVGNALNSADLVNKFSEFNRLSPDSKGYEEALLGIEATIAAASRLNPELAEAAKNLDYDNLAESGKGFLEISNSLIQSSVSSQKLGDSLKVVNSELQRLTGGGLVVDPTIAIRGALDTAVAQSTASVEAMRARRDITANQTSRELEAARAEVARLEAIQNPTVGSDFGYGSAQSRRDNYEEQLKGARFVLEFQEKKSEQDKGSILAGLDKELEIAVQKSEYLVALNEEMNKVSAKLVDLNTKINTKKKEQANLFNLGITFADRMDKIESDRLGLEIKMNEALVTQELATARLEAAKRKGTDSEKAAAQAAYDASVLQVEILEVTQVVERERLNIQEEQINKEKELLAQKRQEQQVATSLLQMERERAAIAAGLTGLPMGPETAGAQRTSQEGILRQRVSQASLAASNASINEADAFFDLQTGAIEETKYEAERKALIDATNNLLAAEQALNIFRGEPGQAIAAVENETRLLQIRKENLSIHPAQQAYNDMVTAHLEEFGSITEANKEKLREQAFAQHELNVAIEMQETLGNSITSNFENAFVAMATGAKNAKEAFADMAKSILADIAKMIAKQLVLNMLTAALGGTSFGNFLGLPAGKTGGVFSEGEKVPGYAVGGIARGSERGYPAMLHGTEAVVPLPNNRSIPVDLKGAGGQQNNITVNVAIDNNGSSEQSSQARGTPEGANLGKAIAAAVQKELMNQKRPGGMLSPHGVA